MKTKLQIVAFDVPYPANYGGVIDVFYKLKALHSAGLHIILHTFEYGRGEQKRLEDYCQKVYYYPRKSFVKSTFSRTPFIVKTRENHLLNRRLIQYGGNILFEGLHTTAPLLDLKISKLNTLVRTHNVEHRYYWGLTKSHQGWIKKLFFLSEAAKLKFFRRSLSKAKHILSISPQEFEYFKKRYGAKVSYLPVFSEMEFHPLHRSENMVLWHGDLRVSDNEKSALFVIEALKNSRFHLVIASGVKHKKLMSICKDIPNITWFELKNHQDLQNLFAKAQVNLLWTYQATGIKLKLMNALTQSRFVLVNDFMVKHTGLEKVCHVANTKTEILQKLDFLMQQSFLEEHRKERSFLLEGYRADKNVQKVINLLK